MRFKIAVPFSSPMECFENVPNFVRPSFRVRWRSGRISRTIPGYSGAQHYAAFERIISAFKVERLLVLGVYFGRDIAFFLDIARHLKRRLSIVGVDKFSDDYCDDWPEESRALNWHQAGFGEPPNVEAARCNIGPFGNAKVIKEKDEIFLAQCEEKFDAIYLDTSHDYETVRRQIQQSAPLLNSDGFLFGDDYSDQGTWGVQRAVTEFLPAHVVLNKWIWLAPKAANKL